MKKCLSLVIAVVALGASADFSNTWTNRVATGWKSWNDAANWDENGVPTTDGTADVKLYYYAAGTGDRYIQLDSSVDIRYLYLQEKKSGSVTIGTNGQPAGKLTLGAGGVTMNPTTKAQSDVAENQGSVAGMQPNFLTPLHLSASQVWDFGFLRGSQNGSYRTISGDISSAEGIDWTLIGYYKYMFSGGSFQNFKGAFHVQQPIAFVGKSQFGRAGSTLYIEKTNSVDKLAGHPMVFYCLQKNETAASVPSAFQMNVLYNCDNSTYTKGTERYNLGLTVNGMCATNDYRLTIDQPWRGKLVSANSLTFVSGYSPFSSIHPQNRLGAMRFVMNGDCSELRNHAGNGNPNYTVRAILELCNDNALAVNNQAGFQTGFEYDGGASGIVGILARPSVTMRGTIQSYYVNGDCNGIPGYSVYGAAQPGAAAVFTGGFGNGGEHGKVHYFYGTVYRLYAPIGGAARFTGAINSAGVPWPVEINGGGDISLENSGSKMKGGLEIRGGRAVVTVGGVTDGTAVSLGGKVPFCYEVKAMESMPFSSPSGQKLMAYDVTKEGVTYPGKYLAVQTDCPNDFDGTVSSLAVGDLVLINVPQTSQTAVRRTCDLDTGVWGTQTATKNYYAYNGIYRYLGKNIGNHSGRMFERIETMDTYEEINRQAYGIRAKVKSGRKFAGTTWFNATRPEWFRGYLSTATTASPCYWTFDYVTFTEINKETKVASTRSANGYQTNFQFHEESAPEPEVAIMIGKAGVTFSNPIQVTGNKSTAASQIGSTVAGTATFSSTITLWKEATIAPASNGVVRITGTVTNATASAAVGLVGGGTGVTDLTSATLKGVDRITALSGTTTVTRAQADTYSLGWRFKDGQTGIIQIQGDGDLKDMRLHFDSIGMIEKGKFIPLLMATGGTVYHMPSDVTGLRPGQELAIENGLLVVKQTSYTFVWVNSKDASASILTGSNWEGGTVPSAIKNTSGNDGWTAANSDGTNQFFDFTIPLENVDVQTLTMSDNYYPRIGYAIGGKERQFLIDGYANRVIHIRDWSQFHGRYISEVYGRYLKAYPDVVNAYTATVHDVHSRREAKLDVMTAKATLKVDDLSGAGYITLNPDAAAKTDSTIDVGNLLTTEKTRLVFTKGAKLGISGVETVSVLPGEPYLVLDAGVGASLVPTEGADGRTYVGRWNDARGGADRPYAVSSDSEKMPWMGTDSSGQPVVDFGYSICDFQGAGLPIDQMTNGVSIGYFGYNGPTLGRTAWMALSECRSDICEVFLVVRDCEWSNGWAQWLGSPKGTQPFQRKLERAGYNGWSTEAVSGLFQGLTKAMKLADVRFDGARTDYNHMEGFADALHVVSVGLEGTATADRLGNNGLTVLKGSAAGYSRGFAVGGFTLAELVIYTNALTSAERSDVNAHLRTKWLSGERANIYTLDQLTMSAGGELGVSHGEMRTRKLTAGVKTFAKSGPGTLALEQVTSNLQMTVSGGDIRFLRKTYATTQPIPTQPAVNPTIWLDAENVGSLVVSNAVDGSGKVFVKQWNHALGNGTNYMRVATLAQFASPANWNVGTLNKSVRYPTWIASPLLGGRHVIDFGALKKLATSSDEYKKYGPLGDPADGCSAFYMGFRRRDNNAFGPMCVRDGFVVVRAKHLYANIISDHGSHNMWRYQDAMNGMLFDPSQSLPVFGEYWATNGVTFRPTIIINDNDFRLYSYRLSVDNRTMNGLGIARSFDAWLGGIDVAEVIQYNRRLSDEEFRDTEAYLMKKWFDKVHPLYAGHKDAASVASIDYKEGSKTKISTEIPVSVGAVKTTSDDFTVEGAGAVGIVSLGANVKNFSVDGGSLEATQDWLSGATLHFDAADTNSIVFAKGQESGRRLNVWRDCRQNGWYAECYLTDSHKRVYTNATYEATADDASSGLLAGSPYVDFGDSAETTGQAGMHFRLDGHLDKSGGKIDEMLKVREWHVVFCLTRTSNYQPIGGELGPAVHSFCPAGNQVNMFYSGCTVGQSAAKRVDGSAWYRNNYYQPSGQGLDPTRFYVQSVVASDYMEAKSIAMDRNSTRGNIRMCELLIYTQTNSTANTEAIHAYLLKKWKGLGEGAVPNGEVGAVDLANGGRLTLGNNVTILPEARLETTASLSGVSSFAVDGTLDISGGAALAVTLDESLRKASGTWTVLSGADILHRENLTYTLQGPERIRNCAHLYWEGNSLKLRLADRGLTIWLYR